MNYIDSTRPAPLSMNELITKYWNSYAIWNSLKIFHDSKYRNPRDKTEALVLFKKRKKQACLALYLSAMHRVCKLAGAMALAAITLNYSLKVFTVRFLDAF